MPFYDINPFNNFKRHKKYYDFNTKVVVSFIYLFYFYTKVVPFIYFTSNLKGKKKLLLVFYVYKLVFIKE